MDVSSLRYVPHVTVLEAIQRGTDFLTRKGVESARLNTELLLAHVLKLPRLKLYLDFQRILSESELAASRDLLQRRGAREPFQQIVGTTSFCGLEISVTPEVLVPRPETELLAERAWIYLNGLKRAATALDFATGSGCISMAIAAHCPQAVMHASDVSAKALSVAKANSARLNLAERIQFHESDRFLQLSADLEFDLIVSNPPYIPSEEIESLSPEVRQFDPHLALDGGADGLQFYTFLAREAPARLREAGKLMIEFGDDQSPALSALFQAEGWKRLEIVKDYSDRERILIAERPQG